MLCFVTRVKQVAQWPHGSQRVLHLVDEKQARLQGYHICQHMATTKLQELQEVTANLEEL